MNVEIKQNSGYGCVNFDISDFTLAVLVLEEVQNTKADDWENKTCALEKLVSDRNIVDKQVGFK